MKRPILIAIIAYIIGIIWGLYFKISIVFLYIFLILLLLAISKTNRKIYRYIKIFINRSVIICFTVVSFISCIYLDILNNKYDNLYKDVNEGYFTGTIINIGEVKEYKTVYKIKINNVNSNNKYKNTILYLNIKNSYNIKLEYGDLIYFYGEYEKPQEASNYKGFNYKEYLKNIKIYGNVNYIKELNVLKKDNLNFVSKLALDFKQKIISNADIVFKEQNTKNIFFAISIGYKDYLNDDIKDMFRDSNLSHILAISGAHISYIILGLTVSLKSAKVNTRINKLITSVILIFYMFVVDFTPSVTRACIMGIILLFSSVIYSKTDIATSISISLRDDINSKSL